MRRFHGRHGELFAIADPYQFHDVPMEDCGGGFDWRMADGALSYWVPDVQPEFWVCSNGVREQVYPVELHEQMGRAGFGRCLEGQSVRVSGACLPLTLLAKLSSWEVNIDFLIGDGRFLGSEGRTVSTRTRETTAVLHGELGDLGDQVVVARLWPTDKGALVGKGFARKAKNRFVLTYDEGVKYESW